MNVRSFSWLLIGLGSVACSGSRESEDPVSAEPASLASCRDDWDSLSPVNEASGFAPRVIRWHDGSLYYQQDDLNHTGFVEFPDTGGTPSDVAAEFGAGPWIEGEKLFYSRFDRLYEVPLPSGPSTLVSNGETFDPDHPRENVTFFNQELDASSLYWVLHRFIDPRWSVWRMPRAGGRSEQVASLPESIGLPAALIVLPDELLVAGKDGKAYVVSKDGDDVRELPTVVEERPGSMWSRFLGAAPSGVAWAVAKQTSGDSKIPYDIVLVDPDGDMQDRWRSMPADFVPDHAWWDDSGRWIIAGTETFTDGEEHTSIWSLDTQDRAKRLACDVRSGRASGYATVAALTDDFAYLVVQYFEPDERRSGEDSKSVGWKLVKVER